MAFRLSATGAYGFPLRRAAPIAVATVAAFLAEHALPEEVYLVCFGADARRVFAASLAAAGSDAADDAE